MCSSDLKGIVTSPDALRDMLKRREDAGIDEYVFRPCTEQLSSVAQLAEVVAGL